LKEKLSGTSTLVMKIVMVKVLVRCVLTCLPRGKEMKKYFEIHLY